MERGCGVVRRLFIIRKTYLRELCKKSLVNVGLTFMRQFFLVYVYFKDKKLQIYDRFIVSNLPIK